MIDTALEALKDILRTKLGEHPEYADLNNLLGLVYAYEGDHKQAISRFQKALEANAQYADGLINLGFSLLEIGELSRASETFNKVRSLFPKDIRSFIGLSLVHVRSGSSDQALHLLRAEIPDIADSFLIHRTMAYVLFSLGRIEEAQAELEVALTMAPYLKKELHGFKVFGGRGEARKRAIRAYFDQVEFNPNYGRLHHELAEILTHHRQFKVAQRELDRGLLADGSLTDYYNAVGSVYHLQGSSKKAIASYEKAVEIDPDCGKAHINLAFEYAEQGQIEDAVREFKIALVIHPDYADLHYNLGLWYLDGQHLEQAETEFRKALELNRDYLMARNSLAYALFRLTKYDEALEEYEMVLAEGLISPDIYTNVGAIYYSKGQYKKASETLRKALSLDPGHPELHYWLGKTSLKLGRKLDARGELKRFLSLAKDERFVREAEELVDQLKDI